MKVISLRKILAVSVVMLLCVAFCMSASATDISCKCDGYVMWNFDKASQKLVCPDCGTENELGDFSGFVTEKESGKLMRFVLGAPGKGWMAYVDDSYYFGDDGMAVTGEQTIDGKTYTFDEEGKFVKGSFVDEAVTVDGEQRIITRYYGAGGIYATRWVELEGNIYYFSKPYDYSELPDDGAMYRGGTFTVRTAGKNSMRKFTFAVDGKLIGGCWEDEKDINNAYAGTRYYWGPEYVTGEFKIDGLTYTFDDQGYLVTKQMSVADIAVDYSIPGAIEPGISVTDNGEPLVNGVNYTLAYEENKDGDCTGVIKITGIKKRGYSGNKRVRFNINHPSTTKHEAVAATCTEKGYTAGEFCTVCNSWATGHEEIPALGHKWTDDSCANAVKTCSVCKVTETVEVTHKEEVIPGKAATCSEKGLSDGKKCTECGKITVEQKEIPTKAHVEEVIPGKPATCSEKGLSDGKRCIVCGTVTAAQVVLAAAHTEVELPAKAATCTEKGLKEGRKCTACGKVTVLQTEVDALGHKFADIPAKPATCTETGLTAGNACVRCGLVKVEQQETEPTGHSFKNATCTEPRTCSKCQLTDGDPLGHKEVLVSGKAATCTKSGKTDGTKCSVCSEMVIVQETIKATGHKEEKIPAVAATYTETGLTEGKRCKICDKVTVAQKKVSRKKLSKVKSLKVKSTKTTEIKLSWKKVTGADSYKVYYSTDGKKWKETAVTKTSVTIKKLKAGTAYQFKVKAAAGDNTGSASSVVKTATKVAKVTLSSVKSSKTKQVVVNWKTVSGASGYVVEYSTSKKFTKSTTKSVTVKKGSGKKTTLKKLTKGKTYYVRVKAYKTVNGKNVYGAVSAVKAVKVK